MSSKILIADDSLTIQKVIGITLANSGYQLFECTKEEDLLNKITANTYDLILLDFNLSDNNSGYDLALEIKKVQPKAGLIVMLGTFDTVDETRFAECGINDKIVKPFESSKFIKKCKDMLENTEIETFVFQEKAEKPIEETKSDNLDSWQVDAPARSEPEEKVEVSEIDESAASSNLLDNEIQGWGFDPLENLEKKYNKVFPPEIEEPSSDLILDRFQMSSEFANSIDNLNSDFDHDETNPTFEVPVDLNRDLLSEIDMEVSTEAFWAVDEIVPIRSEESETITDTNLDEITADLTDSVAAFRRSSDYTAPVIEQEVVKEAKETREIKEFSVPVDMDELVAKLKIALMPSIEAMVKEFCKETAEKVSWEVIPDLAENLIKKEIKELADSIH